MLVDDDTMEPTDRVIAVHCTIGLRLEGAIKTSMVGSVEMYSLGVPMQPHSRIFKACLSLDENIVDA